MIAGMAIDHRVFLRNPDFAVGKLGTMSRVIVASNRVADPAKAAQAGGVAVAIADVLREHDGLWFGWDGKVVRDLPTAERQAKRHGRAPLLTCPLTRDEHEGYYHGYANSVLWPAFHSRLDLARFECGYFKTYASVNARFARLLRPHIGADDLIWVHDYHLIPLAEELRKLGVANRIGFFLHIPFPPAQAFMALPEHRELARGLSAYDLIGLQTLTDVSNLLDYVSHSRQGCLLPNAHLRLLDRQLSVARFPVGIDPADFSCNDKLETPGAKASGLIRIVGVDRLDYSKGLPQKFRAYSRFLDIAPEYRGRAVLTQIAPPTRESVGAYAVIRKDLETLTGSVNGRLGDLQWVPIQYIHRAVPRARLGEIYRASRVGLVTPLRDGMNLVAKEYVAAQDPHDPGVLVLSTFAGAAEDMSQALIVNPYNTEEVASALRRAIEMEVEERRARHGALMATVERTCSEAWSKSFLDRLQSREPHVWFPEGLFRLTRLTQATGSAHRETPVPEGLQPKDQAPFDARRSQ